MVNSVIETFVILAALAAAFASVSFLFQSRHHGIDDHERKLQDQYDDLAEKLLKLEQNNKDHENQIIDDMSNKLAQLNIVMNRYDAALKAFILLMTQEILLISSIVYIGITNNILQWQYVVLIIPGVVAYCFHIFGDLIPAFKTQALCRAWYEARTKPRRHN